MKKDLNFAPLKLMIFMYIGILCLFLILFDIFGWKINYIFIASLLMLIILPLIVLPIMNIIMKKFYSVKYDYNVPDYLMKYIETVCSENNMKIPKIGYIDDGTPNSFAYGIVKNDARIVLTQGIYDLLSPDEIKTVVSHEIGHAIHYDILIMTVIQVIPLLLYHIYETSKRDDGGNLIGEIAYYIYVFIEYFVLWFSRKREYYADEFSIKTTKNPNALASALVKIGYGLTISNENKTADNNEKEEKILLKEKKKKVYQLFQL